MQKKIFVIIIILVFCAYTLTGCYSAEALETLAYAVAIGIDKGENDKKGIPTYEALDDRLKNVLNTDLADMRKPIFDLKGFTKADLKEIAGKLTIMHEEAYKWNASDKITPILDDIVDIHVENAGLTGGKVTPRTFVRSFISVLDTVQQNQSFFKRSSEKRYPKHKKP